MLAIQKIMTIQYKSIKVLTYYGIGCIIRGKGDEIIMGEIG